MIIAAKITTTAINAKMARLFASLFLLNIEIWSSEDFTYRVDRGNIAHVRTPIASITKPMGPEMTRLPLPILPRSFGKATSKTREN
jgi:hypothetical protein